MTAPNKNALMELIGTSSCVAGSNSLNATPNCLYNNFDTPAEKVGSAKTDYSAVMFETFKYFGGYTSPTHANDNVAGTPTDASHFGAFRYSGAPDTKSDASAYVGGSTKPEYETPIDDDNNCAKNYIIFIGNGFPSQDSPSSLLSGVDGDTSQIALANYTSTSSTTNTTLATTGCGAYGTAGACESASWATTYPGYDTYSCTNQTNCGGGNKTFSVVGSATTVTVTPTGTATVPTGSGIRYADEWARFLNRTDVNAATGQQNVKTYTIDVYKDQQDLNETALLRGMASAGGGKYFAAQDENAILNALRKIISEIQSVNSVFASSSLPVSVNTQGTYLNQVFIGMFRPDSGGQPRWAGNLKQYQFAFFADQLKLADKNKVEAVSATTGFMTPCAESFWSTDSGTYWDFPGSKAKGNCAAVSSQFPSAGSSSLFSDLPDGDVVEKGGAAQRLRGEGSSGATLIPSTTNYATRALKTCDGSSATSCTSLTNFNTANAAITQALVGASSATDRGNLIHWVRGKDNFEDENGNTISAEMRPSALGDVVHSQPAAVDFGGATGVVVFYGSNDGVFHAINGNKTADTDGNELWGFVAPETFGRFSRNRSNSPLINLPGISTSITPTPAPKDYFFDGSVAVHQEDSQVWIYPTMRRGGRAIYAFDVTTPTTPSIKWRKGCFTNSTSNDTNCSTGWSAIGQTWSKPKIGYLSGYMDTSTPPKPKPVLIFGGGFDTCEDTNSQTRCTGTRKGANIWFIDADTGNIIRTYPTNYSVPGELVLLKDSSDYVTYVYAADTGGYVYRVNVGSYDGTTFNSTWTSNASASNITIADLSETNHARKFINGLDVVEYATYNAVLVGSGDREHPMLDNYPCGNYSTVAGNFVANAFYMIKDVPSAYQTPLTPANLTDVTTNLSITEGSISAGGWYFKLLACEQVINKSITIGGTAYFGTNQPSPTVPGSCTNNLGTARGYAIDFLTGNPVSGGIRYGVYAGGGLPPSPVAGVVDVDGVHVPFLLGGSKPGVGTEESPLEGTKVPIDPKGTRTRVYWHIEGNE
jgi:type IV pilus assembly protein PilY1